MFPHPAGLFGSGSSKMLAKIAAELGRTCISDLGCNSGDGALVGCDHHARFVKSHRLNITDWRRSCQGLEMGVIGRNTHTGLCRQFRDGNARSERCANASEAFHDPSGRPPVTQGRPKSAPPEARRGPGNAVPAEYRGRGSRIPAGPQARSSFCARDLATSKTRDLKQGSEPALAQYFPRLQA